MVRSTFRASICLVLLAMTAGLADARGGGGGGKGGGGGGRRRASKNAKSDSQSAAILDAAVRRDNLRRSRQVDW